MPRALWSGSLSFGLVNIPVALVPATKDRDIRMRELSGRSGMPVSVRRICTAEDREVPLSELAHGLELDGALVMLTDEELASARPQRTDTIDITRFVDPAEIDPVMYAKPYWVIPSGTAEGPLRAYRLLVQAMQASGRAGTGETVIHNREHPVAVMAREGRLLLHTLLYSHEIRDVDELDIPAIDPPAQAVERAVAIVQELGAEFEPSRYHDRHRERIQALVDAKMKGRQIEPPPEPATPAPVPDLMEALEQSLSALRSRSTGAERKRPSRARRAAPAPRQQERGGRGQSGAPK